VKTDITTLIHCAQDAINSSIRVLDNNYHATVAELLIRETLLQSLAATQLALKAIIKLE